MAVPKRKKSKMRVRRRRGQVKAELAQTGACPNCGETLEFSLEDDEEE